MALEALHKQVLPFVLRRLKEDVLADLPPKIIQDYYCELSPLQKRLYDDFSRAQGGQLDGGGGEGQQHVFQALQHVRRLVNHPLLVMQGGGGGGKHAALLKSIGGETGLRKIEHAPKLVALKFVWRGREHRS